MNDAAASSLLDEPATGHASPRTVLDAAVVIPTLREAENVLRLVPVASAALREAGINAEIIIVDDRSGDGIEAVVHELATASHPVRLLARSGPRSLSWAVLDGFRAASATIVCCMDADGSHPPERLPAMIEPILAGHADFTMATRYAQGGSTDDEWGLRRRITSGVATLLARPLAALSDPMSGYFALRREVVADASPLLDPLGYKIALELLVKTRPARVLEVPIHFRKREIGRSKLTFREQMNYLRHLRRLYRWRRRHRGLSSPGR